jgi:hypothetical protein
VARLTQSVMPWLRRCPPQTFVLLVDDRPIGTASLVSHDLDERPNLTPWLAGVFVIPEARGRGHVIHLIQAVEVACRFAGCGAVWLHTANAERVYARAGWHTVEAIQRQGRRPVTLMRRDLTLPCRLAWIICGSVPQLELARTGTVMPYHAGAMMSDTAKNFQPDAVRVSA